MQIENLCIILLTHYYYDKGSVTERGYNYVDEVQSEPIMKCNQVDFSTKPYRTCRFKLLLNRSPVLLYRFQ